MHCQRSARLDGRTDGSVLCALGGLGVSYGSSFLIRFGALGVVFAVSGGCAATPTDIRSSGAWRVVCRLWGRRIDACCTCGSSCAWCDQVEQVALDLVERLPVACGRCGLQYGGVT